MLSHIRTTFRALSRRLTWERELDDELRLHVDLRAADLARSGMTRTDAERHARMELGSSEAYKEETRAAIGLRWVDELRQDLRFAGRTLRRNPRFTALAAVSLGLGIAANTIVFSVWNGLIRRPLPVPVPSQLYFVQGNQFPVMSYPAYRDLRDRNTTFSGMIAYRIEELGLDTGTGGAERVFGYLATANYFRVLGIQPALGHFFPADADQRPGASPLVVLSYGCWQKRFQGDPGVIGKTIRLDSLPYTVIGVAPRGFRGTEVFYEPELWAPVGMQQQLEGIAWLEQRSNGVLWVAGRTKDGVSRQAAEANLNAIAAGLGKEYPEQHKGWTMHLARLGLMGDVLRSPAQGFVTGIMLIAALLLLAACANLGALAAARGFDRTREIAIRLSIGAGKGRITRQLLTETLLLSLIDGASGCGLAVALLRMLSQWRPPVDFPMRIDAEADWRVLLFSLAISMLTGCLFGVGATRRAWRVDTNDALKGGGARRGGVRRRWVWGDMLLAGQVALCGVLVTASLVSARGLVRAFLTPAGFDMQGVTVAAFDAKLAHYGLRETHQLQRRALEEIERLPGVSAAGFAHSLPLTTDQSTTIAYPEDTIRFDADKGVRATYYDVSPGYFRAMRTRLLAGREFEWRDDRKAPLVAVVNETFAHQVLGKRDAVGQRFRYGSRQLVEIVGVVEDGKYFTLSEEPRAAVFRPAAQSGTTTTILIARSAQPVAVEMQRVIRQVDPALPVYAAGPLSWMLGTAFLPAQIAVVALGVFGVLGLMLALTGVYGLASYSVNRRVREIGIRVTLGAGAGQILRAVLGRIAVTVALGMAAGLALGAAASRVLANVVYQATSRDPVVLGGVLLTIGAAALAAGLGPARRALLLDPVRTLRHE